MRVVFMGTPDFSVPVLDALVQAGHDIVCVYSQPPRPAGRGKKDRPTAGAGAGRGAGPAGAPPRAPARGRRSRRTSPRWTPMSPWSWPTA